MKKIEFSINLTIHKSREEVIDTLFDYDQMKYYQSPPLLSHKLIKGKALEEGTVRILYYSDDIADIMYEGVVKNELNDGITMVQKYKRIKVLLKHSFKEIGQHTLWRVDYTFEMANDSNVDKMGLVKQLKDDMRAFKEYIEHD